MAVSSEAKLARFNGALRLLGERQLGALGEDREPARLLTTVWNDGALDYCLENGQWDFASRIAKFEADPDIDVQFGLQYAFTIPDDLQRVRRISLDERFIDPFLDYKVANDTWYADIDMLYVEYVSNADTYGGDSSKWTQAFTKYLESFLAMEIAPTVIKDERKLAAFEAKTARRLKVARSLSAQQGPTEFLPTGSWVGARGFGRYNSRRDHATSLT